MLCPFCLHFRRTSLLSASSHYSSPSGGGREWASSPVVFHQRQSNVNHTAVERQQNGNHAEMERKSTANRSTFAAPLQHLCNIFPPSCAAPSPVLCHERPRVVSCLALWALLLLSPAHSHCFFISHRFHSPYGLFHRATPSILFYISIYSRIVSKLPSYK